MTRKLTTRDLRSYKSSGDRPPLQMLTCYDYQTAQLFNELPLDLILVGDSLGNVVLGHETTVSVSLEEMTIFGAAVKRGAPHKFTVVDLPFGSYSLYEDGVKNGLQLFQETKAEALKLEGASETSLDIIRALTSSGVPVMGHIGLVPQSVHQMGGYYVHGKNDQDRQRLLNEAKSLQDAGVFSLVLECVEKETAEIITKELSIPTIGIGAGSKTDGQVLVINDLLKMGPGSPPSFCRPIADIFEEKKKLLTAYLSNES